MMFTCITMLCAWCPEKSSFTKSFVDHSVWFENLERGCAKKQSSVKNAAPCSSGDVWPRRKLAAYAWMKKTACDSSIWTSVRLAQNPNSTNHWQRSGVSITAATRNFLPRTVNMIPVSSYDTWLHTRLRILYAKMQVSTVQYSKHSGRTLCLRHDVLMGHPSLQFRSARATSKKR